MNTLKRILLVEDNPKDIELTLAALGEHNLANEVVVARDGAEALDYLNHRGAFKERSDGEPAVIFLDLKLPKVDGLEVLRQLKADARLRLLPVVIVTSSREEPDIQRGYELGANAYVVKPIDFQQFVETIRELGLFWAILNEPPPGSSQRLQSNRAATFHPAKAKP